MIISGVIIVSGLIEEICREHNIVERIDIQEIEFEIDNMAVKFIEQAIESYKDRKAILSESDRR